MTTGNSTTREDLEWTANHLLSGFFGPSRAPEFPVVIVLAIIILSIMRKSIQFENWY